MFKTIKTFIALAVLISGAFNTVFAATGTWEEERSGYTIYASGMYSEVLFYNLQTPRRGTQITNVEWDYVDYDNGFDDQSVDICYRRPFQTSDLKCFDISDLSAGSTDGFNGLDARGTFVLHHTLFGGTYFAYWPTGLKNLVRVTYNY